MSYFEDGQPVPAVDFDFDALDPTPEPPPAGGLEVARGVLMLALDGARPDNLPARVAALGCLFHIWPDQTTAAQAVRVHKSAVCRALAEVRRQLNATDLWLQLARGKGNKCSDNTKAQRTRRY